MTDQINDQISAFIDNELPADESALLVRRFERDAEARARAMRYTLIGSALRGELLEPHPSVLRQRVAAALSGAPPVAHPRARERWSTRLVRPALGVGIAATVAVAAIGLLRSMNEPSYVPGVLATRAVPVAADDTAEEASYVVPQGVDDRRSVTPPIRLTNYLMHHSEYASGLTRTSVHSNVIGAATATTLPVAETAVSKPLPVGQEHVE
jgi:sigma-E factor negative regulatory protein RseA